MCMYFSHLSVYVYVSDVQYKYISPWVYFIYIPLCIKCFTFMYMLLHVHVSSVCMPLQVHVPPSVCIAPYMSLCVNVFSVCGCGLIAVDGLLVCWLIAVDLLLWIGRCGLVADCFLWVGCCGLVVVGQSLWISYCGSVAVGHSLWTGCFGLHVPSVCMSFHVYVAQQYAAQCVCCPMCMFLQYKCPFVSISLFVDFPSMRMSFLFTRALTCMSLRVYVSLCVCCSMCMFPSGAFSLHVYVPFMCMSLQVYVPFMCMSL